ncbi:CaiB/BaiF CoA transferase family protein [Methylobacterium gnaphalii]|uniref:CoA transferase n=1 Tax=Methylobacterium gnaphalii TaxID=1010610 RepID=A0A512JQS5_9HYPH|nr:CaiB/BaiF CoA-transferase family protein [Methylobacterium gnaphalii]GEP12317.1 CoA transferase [Methylobacterium gnaphalii]GJD70901.1 Acetyl-CoA:oxalate CoA-transferase [Methylobacterium gnaphalii]GLS50900.1 CoA transferase [Methylobacterium gnaphalii]
MPGPLVGYRVLDLSRILAGPWVGQLLSDFGAEVWKIERPGTGDDTRQWGPPYLRRDDESDTTESAYFLSANRGKRSVCVDISTPEGSRIVRELARRADVLVENFKVGDMKRYGLDYESLRGINPQIVYCSITGYGQTGPMKDVPGYDMAIQAIGGLMSLTGESDERPGGGPQKVGVPIVDILTGMYSTTAIIAALLHGSKTGIGQHIDMSLLDVQVGVLANQNLNYLTTGLPPKRYGNAHPNIAPYQVFVTKDGSMVLAVGNDNQFRKFCTAAGISELSFDVRFRTNTDRIKNRGALVSLLESCFAARTTDWWLSVLEPIGVPCAPINTLDKVFSHPQVQHRKLQIDLPHASGATAPLVANPVKFSNTTIEYTTSPPLRGEGTAEILRSVLGYSFEDVQRLSEAGVVEIGDAQFQQTERVAAVG